jgi:hypothetical protein
MVEVVFQDGGGRPAAGRSGSTPRRYLAKILEPGVRVALYGKVDFDTYSRELSMMHPEYELLRGDDDEGDESLHTGRIVPVYEAAGKVSTRVLRSVLKRLTDALPHIPDPLPEDIRRRLRLPGLETAIREVHFPAPDTDLRLLNSFRSPAQYRLIFEEFFWLETGMALKHSAGAHRARHRLRAHDARARAGEEDAALQAHARAEEGAVRDRARHGRARAHEPAAAGRCRQRQDHRRRAGGGDRRRERLSGRAARAHRDSRRPSISSTCGGSSSRSTTASCRSRVR